MTHTKIRLFEACGGDDDEEEEEEFLLRLTVSGERLRVVASNTSTEAVLTLDVGLQDAMAAAREANKVGADEDGAGAQRKALKWIAERVGMQDGALIMEGLPPLE